jgi:hypothetical protein
VGLSFKDVADEITLKRPMSSGNGAAVLAEVAAEAANLKHPVPPGNGAAQVTDSAGDAGRMKRAEFAQKYLEKLINLEVRVPVAIDDATKRGLFKPAPEKKPERALTRALTYGLQAAQWAVPVALGVLLLAGAYQLSVIAVPAVERWMDDSRVMPATAKVIYPRNFPRPPYRKRQGRRQNLAMPSPERAAPTSLQVARRSLRWESCSPQFPANLQLFLRAERSGPRVGCCPFQSIC